MGLPVEINPLLISSSGYVVGRSLRFRASASAYLNRTPASAGNRKTWTWSGWVKRGTINGNRRFILGTNNTGGVAAFYFEFNTSEGINAGDYASPSWNWQLTTTQVFRDPSAWYHIVLAFDSTQATSSNRVKLYINGVQVTAFGTATYPSLNYDSYLNNTTLHTIGDINGASLFYDGYLAEVNFIDGQALTPSSFGAYDTNGVWQPLKYGGTYGTNGFYLPFSNTTSTTTLVQDSSGNGNNWTPNNISLTAGTTYDSMIDSPTNSASSSNYAVGNPLNKSSVGSVTLSDGNLNALLDRSVNDPWVQSTIAFPNSGKWYLEYSETSINTGTTPYNVIGVMDVTTATSTPVSSVTGLRGYQLWNGNKRSGTTASAYGSGTALNDIISVAVDMDNGKIWFAVNNTWVNSGSPTAGTNAAFTDLSGTTWSFFNSILGQTSSNSWVNFGQRPFSYTPPSGYSALNTYNLPTPTINNGALYMAATLWTGNGTSQSIANSQSNGGNNPLGKSFYPDFVWYKGRTTTYNHALFDTIRGTLQRLSSNLTSAETATAGSLTAFNSNGFSIGNDAGANQNTDTYVGWQWLAGAGSSSSNTSGSITSTVSANTTAGFSVVTYSGNSSTATVGHGLGVAPSMYIVKSRTYASGGWSVYHTSIGATGAVQLNSTSGTITSANWWNNTAPTSSVFSLAGVSAEVNTTGNTYVAYCWAAVRGYSAFGSYTGNGSTDGPFVYLGFRPRFFLIKRTDTTSNWYIWDSSRNTYNVADTILSPNLTTADVSASSINADILSNGFKLRNSDIDRNASGGTYIYAAFAENPFNSSRAR